MDLVLQEFMQLNDNNGRVNVGIIDDHPVVIEGVRSWLSAEPRTRVVHTGDTVDSIPGEVDVLVMDLSLDGRLVIDEIAGLAEEGRRVVAFSQLADQDVVLAALDAGASAFVFKSEGGAHLLKTVLAVASGESYVTPSVAGALVGDRRPDAPNLSARERTALLWWFQSMSKASVASRMGISTHTVEMYIRRARSKYAQVGREAPTKADMLARAIEDGLIRPEEVADPRPGRSSLKAARPG